MSRAKWLVAFALATAALMLIGVMANTAMLLNLGDRCSPTRTAAPTLPCSAIPTRLVLEDPACAQKLLESMNVTNVRVKSRWSADTGISDETTSTVQ